MTVDKNMAVLIVDDYKTMLRIIRNLLRQIGFNNVDEASDGATALQKLRRDNFGLVISDWNMEPMTGLQLLKEVRADEKLRTLPFIMVTAESKTENVIAAEEGRREQLHREAVQRGHPQDQDDRRPGRVLRRTTRGGRMPVGMVDAFERARAEIDAIDRELQDAFDRIIDAVERVVATTEALAPEFAEGIDRAMTDILEASAVRDIAGQRSGRGEGGGGRRGIRRRRD